MLMKRIFLSLLLISSLGIAASAQIVKSYERPSEKEFRTAVKQVLQKTSCFDKDLSRRLDAINVIQREFNNFGVKDWKAFDKCKDPAQIAEMESKGTPYFYRKAFDKVLKEVKATKVTEGKVVLWNVYNMGYVVKTPAHTFGIDLVQKHLDQLAPELDFTLVTHNHGDHNNAHARNEFALAGVKTYAGFRLDKPHEYQGKVFDLQYVEEKDMIQIGEIAIRCTRVDHNKSEAGKKFVTTYEIDCGASTGNTVIFHTGDAHNYEQLEVAQRPDFFIFHLSVGLNIQKAIDKIEPEYAVFAHVWEMGHEVQKWRWTIDDATTRMDAVEGRDPSSLLCPCWGEKIVYTKKTGSLSRK